MRSIIICVAVLMAGDVYAATMFKCIDAKGRVTFTQSNCPENHQLDDVVSVYNASPSGSSEPVQMAAPKQQPQARQSEYAVPVPARGSSSSGVTVVGGSVDRAPCVTGLSDRDLRTAKVRGELVPGMSRKDVEDMYGKPNNDGHAQGAGSSTYFRDKYTQATSVSFGRDGCAGSSYQSGHKPK